MFSSPSCAGLSASWFIGNVLNNALMSTGAFEIYYDGRLVFSKLAEGRLPTREELFGGIDATRELASAKAAALEADGDPASATGGDKQ